MSEKKASQATLDTELMEALCNSDSKTAAFLIRCGANVNADVEAFFGQGPSRMSTIAFFGWLGDVNILKFLIEAGANLELTGPMGHTALMCAAMTEDLDKVTILLEAGANPDAKSTNQGHLGRTALDFARSAGEDAYDFLRDEIKRIKEKNANESSN